jgi:hypothetical protein
LRSRSSVKSGRDWQLMPSVALVGCQSTAMDTTGIECVCECVGGKRGSEQSAGTDESVRSGCKMCKKSASTAKVNRKWNEHAIFRANKNERAEFDSRNWLSKQTGERERERERGATIWPEMSCSSALFGVFGRAVSAADQ